MKIASNGLSRYVEEHYWGGSSRTWKHATAKLAPAFHALAIDQRGWDQRAKPAALCARGPFDGR
jgi:hypothetical protein